MVDFVNVSPPAGSGGSGGSSGGLTSAQVQSLIDGAGHADQADLDATNLTVGNLGNTLATISSAVSSNTQLSADNANRLDNLDFDIHKNLQSGILAAYDPIRTIVTAQSTDWRWFKIASVLFDGASRGYHVNYEISSRYTQSHGVFRLMNTTDITNIQFVRSRSGLGSAQAVLMRDDADPNFYHILVKVGSYNRHFAVGQRAIATGIHAGMQYNIDYINTFMIGDNTTTETVTQYSGFTQIASITL